MKSFFKSVWPIIQGLLVLAVLAWIGVNILNYLGGLAVKGVERLSLIASKTDAVIIVALLSGTISICGVIISSIIAKVIDYRQNIKRYLFEKREGPYAAFVEMVYDMMHKSKTGEEYKESDLLRDTVNFSKQLTLWGSSKVIKKWIQFRTASVEPGFNPTDNMFLLEEIIFEIRKDMGQKRKGLQKGDILSFFVNDIKKYVQKGSEIKK